MQKDLSVEQEEKGFDVNCSELDFDDLNSIGGNLKDNCRASAVKSEVFSDSDEFSSDDEFNRKFSEGDEVLTRWTDDLFCVAVVLEVSF